MVRKTRQKKTPIPKLPLVFVIAILLTMFFYATSPNQIKQIEKTKTFEEKLRYTSNAKANIKEESKRKDIQKNFFSENTEFGKEFNSDAYIEDTSTVQNQTNYEKLLDTLRNYPIQSTSSIYGIVNHLLMYKGYPSNIIKTEITEINKTGHAGSYVGANFNMQTGVLTVNKTALSRLSTEDAIAILAHELDHFEKTAKMCKSMGIDEFEKLLTQNKFGNIDKEFWEEAIKYTDIRDFNTQYYKDALVRYIKQNDIDLLSSYADFYRIAELKRNPLEISAYEVSDYIYEYYQIQQPESAMDKLIIMFNETDKTIYELTKNNKIIQNERIAIFDYFFAQAIRNQKTIYDDMYNNCISGDNGDLTNFWLVFEADNESFYDKNQTTEIETMTNLYIVLKETNELAKAGLNNEIISNALKYKINTLMSNIVFPNAIENIRKTSISYLTLIKQKRLNKSSDELRNIIILLCIENELYTNHEKTVDNLYYLKIPKEFNKILGITDKKEFYKYLSGNKAFRIEYSERGYKNGNKTEAELLSELLDETRLNIRI